MELQLRTTEAAEAWLGYAPGWWQGSRHHFQGGKVLVTSTWHITVRKPRIHTTTHRNLKSWPANQYLVKQLSRMADGKRGTYPGQHKHFISENTILLLSPSSRQICMVSPCLGTGWGELSPQKNISLLPTTTQRLLHARGGHRSTWANPRPKPIGIITSAQQEEIQPHLLPFSSATQSKKAQTFMQGSSS